MDLRALSRIALLSPVHNLTRSDGIQDPSQGLIRAAGEHLLTPRVNQFDFNSGPHTQSALNMNKDCLTE